MISFFQHNELRKRGKHLLFTQIDYQSHRNLKLDQSWSDGEEGANKAIPCSETVCRYVSTYYIVNRVVVVVVVVVISSAGALISKQLLLHTILLIFFDHHE